VVCVARLVPTARAHAIYRAGGFRHQPLWQRISVSPHLFGNPKKTQARISPDGRYLSWLAPVEGVLNVFIAPVDAPQAAEPH
jgi:hypothetical protein